MERDVVPDGTGAIVSVELFGVPRLIAGAAIVTAQGDTLAAVSRSLSTTVPALARTVCDPDTGWILSGYTFVVDGQFSRDPARPVAAASVVLLVSSAAGG